MWQDFKAFVVRGNVMDLAVAVVLGVAFGAVIKSLVDDIIMPVVGLATGGADFSNMFVVLKAGATAPGPYVSVAAAKAAGAVVLSYGVFVNTIINFLIIAAAIFLIVRLVSRLYKRPAPTATTRPCPFCTTDIPLAATRCPNCTSQIAAPAVTG